MKKEVVHESEMQSLPDICGAAVELITPETSGSTQISFAKLIILPGQKSRAHYHIKMEEIYYIISGIGIITLTLLR